MTADFPRQKAITRMIARLIYLFRQEDNFDQKTKTKPSNIKKIDTLHFTFSSKIKISYF